MPETEKPANDATAHLATDSPQPDPDIFGILINVNTSTGAMTIGYSTENVDLLFVASALAQATAAVLNQMGEQRAAVARAMQSQVAEPKPPSLALATQEDLNALGHFERALRA